VETWRDRQRDQQAISLQFELRHAKLVSLLAHHIQNSILRTGVSIKPFQRSSRLGPPLQPICSIKSP
jgi:hypothetical protein